MKPKTLQTLALGLTLACTGCQTPRTAPTFDAITDRMQEYVDEESMAGAVTLVMHQGKVVHHAAVGLADREQQKPMRPDTIFRIASMTKPVTSAAMLMLQDEGKLHVDDPVSKYLPGFTQSKLNDGTPFTLTIRDIMTHTAGLSRKKEGIGSLSLENVAAKLAAQPLEFAPGTRWQYSQGITLCGRIIEVASAMPYDSFLEQRIFQPLKMKDTSFFPQGAQRDRVAVVYRPGEKGKGIRPSEHLRLRSAPEKKPIPYPSGGLFSTADDMATFYQAILNGGEIDGVRILSPDSVKQMTAMITPKSIEAGFTPGCSWGLGWGVVREPQGVTAMLSPGTFGHGGAYGTQSWGDPVREIVYILMVQRRSFGNGDASIIRGDFQQLASDAVEHIPRP